VSRINHAAAGRTAKLSGGLSGKNFFSKVQALMSLD
jgi:hypothetical protein